MVTQVALELTSSRELDMLFSLTSLIYQDSQVRQNHYSVFLLHFHSSLTF